MLGLELGLGFGLGLVYWCDRYVTRPGISVFSIKGYEYG
jgi:hypothetical protein